MTYEKRDSMAEKSAPTYRHTLSFSETVIICAQETALMWFTRSKSCYSTKKDVWKSCSLRLVAQFE